MKEISGLNGFLSLANILLFPSVWLKWLLLAGIILSAIGGSLTTGQDSSVFIIAAILGGFFTCTSAFIMLLVLPGQLLAVNSSKIISILPGIRILSLIVLFAFCVIFSLSIALLLVVFVKTTGLLNLLFSAFLIISFLVTCNIVIVQLWSWAQFCVFLLVIAIPAVLGWLQTTNIFFVFGLNVLLWLGFTLWWCSWRPNQFLENTIGKTYSQMLLTQERNRYGSKNGIIFNSFFGFRLLERPLIARSGAIKTYLTGENFNWLGYVQKSILLIAISSALMFFVCAVAGTEPVFKILNEKLFFFMSVVYLSFGQRMLFRMFPNIKRIWLICEGSRAAIFSLVERIFLVSIVASILPFFIIHVALCVFFPEIFLNPLFSIILFAFFFQNVVITFYLNVLMYAHPRFGFAAMHLVNMIMGALSLAIIAIARIFLLASEYQTIFYAVITFFAGFTGAFFLRVKAIKVWPKSNFLRPVN